MCGCTTLAEGGAVLPLAAVGDWTAEALGATSDAITGEP